MAVQSFYPGEQDSGVAWLEVYLGFALRLIFRDRLRNFGLLVAEDPNGRVRGGVELTFRTMVAVEYSYDEVDDPLAQSRPPQSLWWTTAHTGLVSREEPFLQNLVVAEAARRQGVGSALVEHCENLAALHWNQQATMIGLNVEDMNKYAQAWYKRRGYEETNAQYLSTSWEFGNSTNTRCITFRKPLPAWRNNTDSR
eukprot:CAMPEP_0184686834 /NCGR_PEP_ID=MMETSP0312-20130426/24197_1 /TAXON_ID=31354 /ORGANISM="Compsopogon coeruleus, Strain SAG 36.94" /LENGTH=196 /DNA_ID=CAMNT_0027142347 /DNA_START=340 /DNA_END=930 /DNA_ORIENTATION=-